MLSKFKKSTSQEEEDKPLLKLIKKLVNLADNEQKTVLTNSHMLSILCKDLNVNIWAAHPYEVDVCMNILKSFLKEWPNWDRVAQAAQKYKQNPKYDIDSILIREYEDCKEFLKGMLELSEPIRKENVAKLTAMFPDGPRYSTTDAILEITCSRNQLNKLIFTQPHPEQADTIFNIDEENSKIQTQVFKLEELLYWPNLCFHVTIGPYEFVRKNEMHLQHTIINKKLSHANTKPPKLSTDVYSHISNRSLLGSSLEQTKTIEYFNSLINKLPKRTLHRIFISNLLLSIVKDLTFGPKCIDQGNEYKYFPSRDAYVRYLRTDVNLDAPPPSSQKIDYNKFLLSLEEIMIPSVVFKLKRNMINMTINEVLESISNSTEGWIKVECLNCKTKFEGLYSMTDLKNHILYSHGSEPDIQCMGCQKEFSMRLMAYNSWKHECTKTKNLEANNHGAKNHGANNHVAKNSEAKGNEAKNIEANNHGSKNHEANNHVPKNNEAKSNEAKKHGSKNHRAKHRGAKHRGAKK